MADAKVLIIGGGVAGCSAQYHLALRGWTDTLLLEMDELTSGSTWHAAGNIPTFSGSRNIMKLQHYSTQLYVELAKDPAYPINYHQTGSIRLAQGEARWQEFQHVHDMANAMDLSYELLTPEQMQERSPLMSTEGLIGGLWDPHDGDIDPSQLTQALAAASRKMGAEIKRFTKVTSVERVGKLWKVTTPENAYTCEHVVNAAGYRAGEVSELFGQYIPVVSMQHQYLVTESVPELEQMDSLMPLIRDPDDSYYLRQEKTGLILGPYEKQATPHWADGKLPDNFAYQLYPDDLERLEWYIEQACERLPILGSVGVQRVINGPIPYTPDGIPNVGPAKGLENVYHCNSFSFGICQGGGAGKTLSEWIIDGRPEWDMWTMDSRRYGDYADQDYVVDRAKELYGQEYAIFFPHDEWPGGRPRLTSPLYDTLKAKNAQYGARGGYERPMWFAQAEDDVNAEPGYGHGGHFEAAKREALHVATHAGVLDLCGFAKFELKGAGAAQWLDAQIAGRVPSPGRLSLSYFCYDSGGIGCEMTITGISDEHFILIGGAPSRVHDLDWLEKALPEGSSLTITDITDNNSTIVLAGPKSRDVLQPICDAPLDNDNFKWLSMQQVSIAGHKLMALRVNYIGELGWELHLANSAALDVYNALFESALNVGIDLRDFGQYAMDGMRLEKGYRAMQGELDHETSPIMAGLDRFIKLDKDADFPGKAALRNIQQKGTALSFVQLQVDDTDFDAIYGSTIMDGDKVIGYTTSGGFGYRINKSVALGYVNSDKSAPGTAVSVRILGNTVKATVVAEPLFDPENEKLRA